METEYRWFISGGKPRLINNPTLPDTEFHGSAMAVENYTDPTTGKEASAAKSKFSPPIPDRNFKSFRGMWHIKPNFNNGKPYTGFMLIPEPTPPPANWQFSFSSKKTLFSIETDMQFGIEISGYKFMFSINDNKEEQT